MGKTILIVEDEFLVALNLSRTLAALGFETVGIAHDGETGPDIGRRLAKDYGAAVLFLTANPACLGDGVDGTIGCISKPVDETEVETVLDYLTQYRSGQNATPPPSLRVFQDAANAALRH